jgi:hypothetical protein
MTGIALLEPSIADVLKAIEAAPDPPRARRRTGPARCARSASESGDHRKASRHAFRA